MISPGGWNGNLLQYPCLENPMDKGAWQATAHEVTKSQTQPSDWAHMVMIYIHILWNISVYKHTDNSRQKKGKAIFISYADEALTILIQSNIEENISLLQLKFI